MQSLQLGRLGVAPNLRSEQLLAPPAEDVINGLKFLVDLPMQSLMGQQDEQKPWGAAAYQLGNTSSRTITEVKQR